MASKVDSLTTVANARQLSFNTKPVENDSIEVFPSDTRKANVDEINISTTNQDIAHKEKSDTKKKWFITAAIALGTLAVGVTGYFLFKNVGVLKKTKGIPNKDLIEVQKTSKYLQKQADDIVKYGEKTVLRENVSETLLDKYTPFRRLSQKPCTLSDPKYFIEKFEKNMGKDFLPLDWGSLSEAQKVDYIVKDRYSKLVSHKIMNNIKGEEVENLFSLNKSGDIIGYSKGVVDGVGTSIIDDTAIAIHNHPAAIWYEPLEFKAAGYPKFFDGHSKGDIGTSVSYNVKSYVVDSLGNKFLFEPVQNFSKIEYNRKQLAQIMQMKIDPGSCSLNFAIENINRSLDKLNLEDYSKLKFKEMSGVFEEQINTIKEFADKGWCKYTIISS